ncbi:MAG: hypothetical protein F4Y14_15795 [Acidobacteria bacterium]|nr:hypothetical protein [Acidobacteriota bacterium]
MKLMKHITIALVLCAIPAVAVGQTVSCETCTHVMSVYYGDGGLIAMTDAEEVTYVATCEGITRSGELMPNDDGMVAMLIDHDNGLACHGDDEDNSFEIGPLMDGGWYWLTMETNSAVGGLVSMDILENDMVDIADAGEGVMMTMGKGAVLLSETATGRVGILPTILPEPPMDPAAVCGPRQSEDWPYRWSSQATSSCMLGGGGTKIRLVGPGAHGSTAMITNGMVYRPNAGTITVTADLWVDESGAYSTDEAITTYLAAETPDDAQTLAYRNAIQKGWAGKTATAQGAGSGENWLTATFTASVEAAVGTPVTVPADGSDDVAGVTLTNTGTTTTRTGTGGAADAPLGKAVFTIGTDTAYCSRTANHTAVLNVLATEGTNAIHPPVSKLRRPLQAYAAAVQLRIVCPPASANMGRDLVPDNPFPVE